MPPSLHCPTPESSSQLANRRISAESNPKVALHAAPYRRTSCSAQTLEYRGFAQPEIFQRFPAVHQSLTAVPNFVLSRECVTPERDHEKSTLPTSHPSTPTLGLGLELHLLCLQFITRLLEVVDDASQTQEGKGGDVRGR